MQIKSAFHRLKLLLHLIQSSPWHECPFLPGKEMTSPRDPTCLHSGTRRHGDKRGERVGRKLILNVKQERNSVAPSVLRKRADGRGGSLLFPSCLQGLMINPKGRNARREKCEDA